MTKVKFLLQNAPFGKNIQGHRTHRTKRMKGGYKRRMERIMYKNKLLKLKLKDLE